MIYVKISGRLGNNLFQIATAKHLSENICIVASNKNAINVYNQYKDNLYSGIPIINTIPQNVDTYTEKQYKYEEIPVSKSKDLYISGFFQSYKYFSKEEAGKLFKIPDKVANDIENRYGEFLKRNTVSINVRRGDYLNLPHRHPFCGLQYYKKAIAKFPSDTIFIVSSDDIKWCKKNFIGDNFLFVENSYPLLDLFIQTKCTHNIISNSSFSWWGAYLNQNPKQIVIAPRQWYGISLKHINTCDLLPNNTIYINCEYSFHQKAKAYALFIKEIIKSQLL